MTLNTCEMTLTTCDPIALEELFVGINYKKIAQRLLGAPPSDPRL